MKTAILTPCWLDGREFLDNGDRLDRYKQWLDYMLPLMPKLGADRITLVDNASHYKNIIKLKKHFGLGGRENLMKVGIDFQHYENHLARKSHLDYEYCWRVLYHAQKLIDQGYEKILMIDSDLYILSNKLTDYLRESNSGWEAFWSEFHNFPEAALQIMNKDAYSTYFSFTSQPWSVYNGKMMETLLPYSVNKNFVGDRYPEKYEIPIGTTITLNLGINGQIDYFAQGRVGDKYIHESNL